MLKVIFSMENGKLSRVSFTKKTFNNFFFVVKFPVIYREYSIFEPGSSQKDHSDSNAFHMAEFNYQTQFN